MPIRLGNCGEERVFRPSPNLKTVNIVAMGRSLIDYANTIFADRAFGKRKGEEVWTVNAGGFCFQHHVSFNMHDFAEKDHQWVKDWYPPNWPWPVVTCRAMEDMPFTLEYPLEEVMNEFQDSYLVNGVSYMVAIAILAGVEHINFFGCDYHYRTDQLKGLPFEHGRPNLEYWMGRARQKGIGFSVAASSSLGDMQERMEHGMYGYINAQPILEVVNEKGFVKLKGFQSIPPAFEEIDKKL